MVCTKKYKLVKQLVTYSNYRKLFTNIPIANLIGTTLNLFTKNGEDPYEFNFLRKMELCARSCIVGVGGDQWW